MRWAMVLLWTMARFNERCRESFLQLNVTKTKDMWFDFPPALPTTIINCSAVETLSQYKFLGTILDDKLCGCSTVL